MKKDQAMDEWVTPSCVDAERLAAWSSGTLSAAEAAGIERHLSNCARCQAMLAVFTRIEPAPAVVVPFWQRWSAKVLVPIAAAAALVLAWVAWPTSDTSDTTRAPAQTLARSEAVAPPALTSPPPAADASLEKRAAGQQGEAATSAKLTPAGGRATGFVTSDPAATPAQSKTFADSARAANRGSLPQPVTPSPMPTPASPAPRVLTPTPIPTPTPIAVARATPKPEPPPPPAAPATMPPPPAATPTGLPRSSIGLATGAVRQSAAETQTLAAAATVVVAEFGVPNPTDSLTTSTATRSAGGGRAAGAAGGRGGGGRGGATTIAISTPVRYRILATGIVERSETGGASWERIVIEPPAFLTAGVAPSSTVCWLIGRGGVILLSTDGVRFTRVRFPDTSDLTSIRAADARTATVTTTDGRTFATADGGTTWTPVRLQGFPTASF